MVIKSHLTITFLSNFISKLICDLKVGKSAGYDGIAAEHLLHCHPSCHVYITYLCNLMLLTGYVPSQFGIGLTFPIPKGKLGQKICSVEDFRGISVSPVISKILEKAILENFSSYLWSSDNQFGFKKKVGCSHAIYSLKSVIDHFVNNGSTVNLCSLDVSKAFDHVNHYALFTKLMERHIPVCVVMMFRDWYSKWVGLVIWKGFLSASFPLLAGVRQGGCLSPVMFSILINCLISSIVSSNLGCHVGILNFGILMYADDLVLLSAFIHHLQLMINICLNELFELDLSINAKKSVCVRFGRRFNSVCSSVCINDVNIPWSDSVKYLGIVFTSGHKLSYDFKPSRADFFRSFNSIFSKVYKANETVIVSLIKSKCIPVLMYGLEALDLNQSNLNKLDNPLYQVFGKIFKSFDKKILNNCMFYLDTLPLNAEYLFRKINFLRKMKAVPNSLLKHLSDEFGSIEIMKIYSSLQLEVVCSREQFRRALWKRFESSLV